jgi:VTC domain
VSQTTFHERAHRTASAGVARFGTGAANEWAVHEATDRAQALSLDELLATAELLTRVDRKYFVPAETFRAFAAQVGDDFRVLEMGGLRLFAYESVYFDTPDLATYRAHLQGRRRRFKVRTRTYLDSQICMLEVKLKGPRAATVKMRSPHPHDRRGELTPAALTVAADFVHDTYGLALPAGLGPVLTTTNRRATFVSHTEAARFTCDIGLICRGSTGEVSAKGDHVLVESKAGASGSLADRTLRDLGIRPVSVSKYCIGIAVTHPEVASNPWHRTLRAYFDEATPVAA